MRYQQITENISQLKTDIIQQVKGTDDEELLDRIYTVLNKSGLVDRIAGTLERETDTSGYVTDLTQLIIDTPGTYKEKHDFINGFPRGYVNVELMLSGKRVQFEQLLEGGDFVRRVFDKLKRVTFGTAKGPGEFALAVMSPHIKITGKGDLNIGDQIIEVKASAGKEVSSGGGRLGTPGLLHSDNVESIIAKHLKINMAKAIPSGNLGLGGLIKLTSRYPNDTKKALGKELFSYIFKREVSVAGLVNAFVAGDEAAFKDAYIKANYELYRKDSGFNGVMLMNFALGELQYYDDPAVMIENVYDPAVYIISKDKAAQARQIISQVTLRPFKEPPVEIPEPPAAGARTKQGVTPQQDYQAKLNAFAVEWARRRGITDPATIQQIAAQTLASLQKGMAKDSVIKKLNRLFPRAVASTVAEPAQQPEIAPANEPAPPRARRPAQESVRIRRT